MKLQTIAICAVAALAAGPGIAQVAQDSPGRAPQATETVQVSDAELETFATIYVDLLQTIAKFEPEMQNAQSEQQANEIRTKVQDESVAKVARHGWTPEKFNSVTDAINANQTLADKAAKLIQEKT